MPNDTSEKRHPPQFMFPNTVLLILLAISQVTAAPHTFTDTQGRSLQAEYITSDASGVTLSIAGKLHTLPMTRFSTADQAWIVDQKKSAAPAAGTAPPASTAFPPMTQRQIAEHFLKERGEPQVNVMVGTKLTRVTRLSDLPAEDFYILAIFERPLTKKPFPWSLLQQMPKLMDLKVSSVSPISTADLVHLNALKNPFSLSIECDHSLDSAAVAAIAKMESLKVLTISRNLILEKDLPLFASRVPNLERFLVMNFDKSAKTSQVTDQALSGALPTWKSLQHLFFKGMPFTAATAKAISSCRKLEELGLQECEILSPQDFAPLAGLRSLKKLSLRRITQLSAQDVQDIQKTLKDCQVEQQN